MDEIRIHMMGVPMTLLFSGSFFKRCKDQTRDTIPYIQHLIVDLLKQRDVADYVLHEVQFGEEVVIADSLNELSFVIQVTQENIYVNTFLSEWATGQTLQARAAQWMLTRSADRRVTTTLGSVA